MLHDNILEIRAYDAIACAAVVLGFRSDDYAERVRAVVTTWIADYHDHTLNIVMEEPMELEPPAPTPSESQSSPRHSLEASY